MKPMVAAAHVEVAAKRLWSRVEAALVERARGFSSREAGDFLTGEIPDGVTVPGLDYTVEDLEPKCPKCPHWRHTGDTCAACSCVSIFVGNTTRETGPRRAPCGQFRASHHDRHCIGPCDAKTSAPTSPRSAVDETGAVLPPSAPVSPNDPDSQQELDDRRSREYIERRTVEHTIPELLLAAANQLELWRTGARMTRQRARFLCELVPDLNAASQLPVQLGSQRGISPGEVSAAPPDPAPSPGHSIPELLCNGAMAIDLLLDGQRLHNIPVWRKLADDMLTASKQLINQK